MNPLKILLIALGTVSLTLGVIGIVVPGLPTTPFLLLTAGLYVKSSDRLYNKLISNRWVGHYISDFRRRGGMTRVSKIISIITMWIMITVSSLFFIQSFTGKIAVAVAGIIGTVVMGFIVRTAGNEGDDI